MGLRGESLFAKLYMTNLTLVKDQKSYLLDIFNLLWMSPNNERIQQSTLNNIPEPSIKP